MSASPSVASTPDPSASDAAGAAVEAITGAANQDVTFSLALTQDQKDIRDWIHGFAADVVRPAAHEWDEKEQTPWPIIEEAAKIGLYGFEGLAQFFADPSGLTLPIVNEELFWGDAGIGMSIMGTSLAVAFAADGGVHLLPRKGLVAERAFLAARAVSFDQEAGRVALATPDSQIHIVDVAKT